MFLPCSVSRCVPSLFSQVHWASLWPLLWMLHQVNCLSLCLFFWSFVLLFQLKQLPLSSHLPHFLCLFEYVLSKSVISPVLEGVGLLRRYTLWIRSAVPHGTQRQVLKEYPLCGLYTPSSCGRTAAGVKACWWVGLASSLLWDPTTVFKYS